MPNELARNAKHFLRTEWKTLTVFALWMLTLMVLAYAGIRYVIAHKHDAVVTRPNQPIRQAERPKCPLTILIYTHDKQAGVIRIDRADDATLAQAKTTNAKCVECHKPQPKAE